MENVLVTILGSMVVLLCLAIFISSVSLAVQPNQGGAWSLSAQSCKFSIPYWLPGVQPNRAALLVFGDRTQVSAKAATGFQFDQNLTPGLRHADIFDILTAANASFRGVHKVGTGQRQCTYSLSSLCVWWQF